jgi:hypothetical protein
MVPRLEHLLSNNCLHQLNKTLNYSNPAKIICQYPKNTKKSKNMLKVSWTLQENILNTIVSPIFLTVKKINSKNHFSQEEIFSDI